MARELNKALWAEWRDRVARYERRAETSAEFCRREGVSMASLFSWPRRLAIFANHLAKKRCEPPRFGVDHMGV